MQNIQYKTKTYKKIQKHYQKKIKTNNKTAENIFNEAALEKIWKMFKAAEKKSKQINRTTKKLIHW